MTFAGPDSVDASHPPLRRRMHRPPWPRWKKNALLLVFCAATLLATWTAVKIGLSWIEQTKTISFFVTRNGPDRKFAEKLSQIIATNSEFIRLVVTPSDDPVGAFTRRECDLAIARSDLKLPGWARAVANLEKEVVLLVAKKGVKAETPAAIKKLSFIIPSLSPADQALLHSILEAYEIGKDEHQPLMQANVDLIASTLRGGQDKAVFMVAPMSRLVQGHLLGGLPQKLPIALLDWPDSKALDKKVRGLAEETIDTGLFSVSPLLPADELDTISLMDLLLTRNQLRETTVAEIAKTIFEFKNDLAIDGEFATSIEPPDTDKDADVLAHPGAVQYVNDDEKTFLDRYSDVLYLSMPLASVIGSFFLFLYSRLTRASPRPAGDLTEEVLAVSAQVRAAQSEDELSSADARLEDILHETLHDLQARRLTPEGLDVFRLAYEQTREWIKVKRRALEQGSPPKA